MQNQKSKFLRHYDKKSFSSGTFKTYENPVKASGGVVF